MRRRALLVRLVLGSLVVTGALVPSALGRAVGGGGDDPPLPPSTPLPHANGGGGAG